jgi:hypothetical protein
MKGTSSGFPILEQICDLLVQATDGLEKLVHACGLTGHLLFSQIHRYRFAELSCAADPLSCNQRQHGLRISIQ